LQASFGAGWLLHKPKTCSTQPEPRHHRSAQALLPGGWLRTGDLGALDSAGRLWLVGRAKDTVKSGGENVHAAEVEAALEQHPAVAAAAVVGLPHSRLGEMVG
jgi:acyl-activating enzyme 14